MECLIVFNPQQCQANVPRNCPKARMTYANYKCPQYVCKIDLPSTMIVTSTTTTVSTVSTVKSSIVSTSSEFWITAKSNSLKMLVPKQSRVLVHSTTMGQQLTEKSNSYSSSEQLYKIWAIVASSKLIK